MNIFGTFKNTITGSVGTICQFNGEYVTLLLKDGRREYVSKDVLVEVE